MDLSRFQVLLKNLYVKTLRSYLYKRYKLYLCIFYIDRIRKALAATLPWIEDGHPIMIRGPEACGKNALIDVALARIKNQDTMTVVRGSSFYGPDDLVSRLKKACLRLESSSQGRTYKPRSGSRVLLILEDMHLAAKDLQV